MKLIYKCEKLNASNVVFTNHYRNVLYGLVGFGATCLNEGRFLLTSPGNLFFLFVFFCTLSALRWTFYDADQPSSTTSMLSIGMHTTRRLSPVVFVKQTLGDCTFLREKKLLKKCRHLSRKQKLNGQQEQKRAK